MHRRHSAAQVRRELRALAIAAAAQSGDGCRELYRQLKTELQQFSNEVATGVQTPVSQAPASAEEFAAMMAAGN